MNRIILLGKISSNLTSAPVSSLFSHHRSHVPSLLLFISLDLEQSDYFYFSHSVWTIVAYVWDPHLLPYNPFLVSCLSISNLIMILLSFWQTGAGILMRLFVFPTSLRENWMFGPCLLGGSLLLSRPFLSLLKGEKLVRRDLQKQLLPFHYCLITVSNVHWP